MGLAKKEFKFTFDPQGDFFMSYSPLIITPLWWGLTLYYSLFLSWPMLETSQLLCGRLNLIADIVYYRLQCWLQSCVVGYLIPSSPICSDHIPFHADGWVRYSLLSRGIFEKPSYFEDSKSRIIVKGFVTSLKPKNSLGKILVSSGFDPRSIEAKFYKVNGLPSALASPSNTRVLISD